MVWYDPKNPLEAAKELLSETRKFLGRNRPVIADRLISEALKNLTSVTESSTTPKSVRNTTAGSAENCER